MRNVYVNQGILEDEEFWSLSHEGQRAWWLLRFNAGLGISGLARMTWKTLREILDLPDPDARAVVAELARKWIRYDESRGCLWFVDVFRHERNRSPNTLAAVTREIRDMPRSEILTEWWKAYEITFSGAKEERRAISIYIGGASEGLRRGSPGASKPLQTRDSVSGSVSGPPDGGTPERAREVSFPSPQTSLPPPPAGSKLTGSDPEPEAEVLAKGAVEALTIQAREARERAEAGFPGAGPDGTWRKLDQHPLLGGPTPEICRSAPEPEPRPERDLEADRAEAKRQLEALRATTRRDPAPTLDAEDEIPFGEHEAGNLVKTPEAS